jgi:RimJ/RimL family protein N-acetyltransferase
MIRPFNEAVDFEPQAQIHNACCPGEPTTPELIRHRRSMLKPETNWEGLVAEKDGRVIGIAAVFDPPWLSEPSKQYFSYRVDPNEEGSPLSRELFDRILNIARERKPARIHTDCESHHPVTVNLLEQAGFEMKSCLRHTELRLENFDPNPFIELKRRHEAEGVQFKRLADYLDTDFDWKTEYLALMNRSFVDLPFHTAFTEMTMEVFEMMLQTPGFDHRTRFLAEKDGGFIGVSEIIVARTDSTRMITGLTAVDRPYRGRGLATALKAVSLSHAKQIGGLVVGTENEENNPMLRLNYRLGFVDCYDILSYVLTISS